jgi:sugar (pentulose or hexulose) kinase
MAPSMLNMVAFDLGAESGRAILGQFTGSKISLSDVHRFPNTPVLLPDGLHWNILALWEEIKRGLSLSHKQCGTGLASIGLDTWGVDFGLLDRQGNLIGNPYHYRDSRTDGLVDKSFHIVPREEIYANTGIQFMQLNSLFQLFAMVNQNHPALEIADRFLTIPDLLNYWLTGRKVNEYSNATTTQCYDTRKNTWSTQMLEQLGIPSRIFGEVVRPGTVIDQLSPAVAMDCEVSAMPVIAPACHDTGSAVAAVPATGTGFAWISSGTWSIMGVEASEPVVTSQSLAYGMTNEGGVYNTIRLSKNIMGLWPVQECKRTWARHGQDYSYDQITQMAADAPSLRSVVDVDHNDFLKPGDMPSRIQEYCSARDQEVPQTHGEIIRAALEGVALKYRSTLDGLENLQGRKIDVVHIVGGGTRNKILCQFAADAMNRTVITGPIEATATGNLLVQAIALGEIRDLEEAREVVRNSFEVTTYHPSKERAAWEDAYGKLQAAM